MAFNLKKVLKALLLSSSQPLAIKDIQAAFTRFHDTDTALPLEEAGEEGQEPSAPAPEASGASSEGESAPAADPSPAGDPAAPAAPAEAASEAVEELALSP